MYIKVNEYIIFLNENFFIGKWGIIAISCGYCGVKRFVPKSESESRPVVSDSLQPPIPSVEFSVSEYWSG